MLISLKRKLMNYVHHHWMDGWANKSYSQEGEDLILRRIFDGKRTGFYVDVGAHHPQRFSNTYLFYKQGWRGINIDAMPGSMRLFSKVRPRDINLELGVGATPGFLDYYIFNEPALNGFSQSLSQSRHENPHNHYRVIDIKRIEVQPLSTILDNCLPVGQEIDFMSIDVEGWDFEAIRSNDWKRYRPRYLLAEILESSLDSIDKHSLVIYLKEKNYVLYSKCMNTVIFMNAS
jgi:FkbM family methyltransferase